MELGELKVFLTVASERSFSRAAAKLYRSQPAISQAVRRLEDQLGEPLFDRTMKHGTLTPAGEVLFREGTRLLRLAEETAAAVRRQSEQERGIIRIGVDEAAVHTLLPAIDVFLSHRPDINLDVRRLTEHEVIADVAAGVVDVGAVTSDRVPSRFQQLRITPPTPGLAVLMSPAHRHAMRREVPVAALQNERVILVSDLPHLYQQITRAIAESGAAPAAILGMPGVDGAKRAVEMGLGIAIVPGWCASDAARRDTLVSAHLAGVEYTGTVTVVYRESEALSKSTAAFIDTLTSKSKVECQSIKSKVESQKLKVS